MLGGGAEEGAMETQEVSGPRPEQEADVLAIRRPSARALLTGLAVVLGVLVVLDLAAWASGLESGARFSLDDEITVATWWASVQLLLLASMFGLVALQEYRTGRRSAAWTLGIGALVATFFSIDETAAFHEEITRVFRSKDVLPSFNGGRGLWIFVYMVAAIVLFAITLRGILSLLRSDRTNTLLVALGGALFVLGGVVVEAIGYSVPSHAEVVVEEVFEFLGIAIMVWATYRMLGGKEIRMPLE